MNGNVVSHPIGPGTPEAALRIAQRTAVQTRDWAIAEQAFNRYGAYLELVEPLGPQVSISRTFSAGPAVVRTHPVVH